MHKLASIQSAWRSYTYIHTYFRSGRNHGCEIRMLNKKQKRRRGETHTRKQSNQSNSSSNQRPGASSFPPHQARRECAHTLHTSHRRLRKPRSTPRFAYDSRRLVGQGRSLAYLVGWLVGWLVSQPVSRSVGQSAVIKYRNIYARIPAYFEEDAFSRQAIWVKSHISLLLNLTLFSKKKKKKKERNAIE